MKKRLFSIVLALTLVIGLLSGCGGGGIANEGGGSEGGSDLPTVNWKLASTFAEGTMLFECDKAFTEKVKELSNGKFVITPYGSGELGASNQVFDMVQGGTIEAGADWPSYWSGKDTGFDLLATTMFNFTGWDYYIWIYEGGGLEDGYNYMFNKFGMKYFPHGITQMESGIRTNKPIEKLADLNGMKIRFAGKIQGLVAEKIGIAPVTIATDELYEGLQRGVVDGAEYSSPTNDDMLKIQEVTKYWLAPGWHQTASVYGIMVNQKAYDALPAEYQRIIEIASKWNMQEWLAKNAYSDAKATAKMVSEGVTVTNLPEEEMALLEGYVMDATEQLAAENPNYAHVLNSMMEYRKTMDQYRDALGQWGFGFNLKEYPEIPAN